MKAITGSVVVAIVLTICLQRIIFQERPADPAAWTLLLVVSLGLVSVARWGLCRLLGVWCPQKVGDAGERR